MQNKKLPFKIPVKKKKPERQTDIYAVRKQKKRRKILKRSIWFILAAMLLIVIYQRRDVWLPQLETIGGQKYSLQPGDNGEGGAFPIPIYSGTKYQAAVIGEFLAVLSDSYFQVYDHSGSLKNVRQHIYGNALLRTEGGFALIYESGGTQFRLETAEKTVCEKTVADPIIFGTVSSKGYTALITSSQTCACKLIVCNEKGQEIYSRACVEQLSAVTFLPDSTGCYAVSLGVENGIMQSYVHKYSFSEESEVWSSKPLDTFAISVYNTNDGGVCLMGDTKAAFLTQGGGILKEFTYPDTFEQGCFAGDTAVLLLSNQEQRTRSLMILSLDASEPVVKRYDREIKNVGILPESREALVQMRSQLVKLKYDGTVSGSEAISDAGDSFIRFGSDILMLGYNSIDRQEIP